MKKKALTILLASMMIAASIISLTGCAKASVSKNEKANVQQKKQVEQKKEDKAEESLGNKKKIAKPSYTSLNYSNLIDKKTQNEAKQVLEKNKINVKYINNYFELINDYNKLYKNDLVNKSGFSTTKKSQIEYDNGVLSEKWTKSHKYIDINCRLSAFSLFRDFVKSGDTKFNGDISNLGMDLAMIEENPIAKAGNFTKSNVETFKKIFSTIKVGKFGNDEEMSKLISDTWKKRGIKFNENKDVTLINGFIKDEDLKDTYVGHAGISVKNGDEILFIEKYSPAMPFQVTKFKNKKDLRSYMFDRLITTEGDMPLPAPIIMENDKLMK